MKTARSALICLSALALLLVLFVGLAFLPPVQTWVVRKALAKSASPGLEIHLEAVSIGLSHARIQGLSVKTQDLLLTAPLVESDLSILKAVFRRVDIHALEARGWTLEFKHPGPSSLPVKTAARGRTLEGQGDFSFLSTAFADTPSPIVAQIAAFNGLLTQVTLPVVLSVDKLALQGVLLVPGKEGLPSFKAELDITGGDLGQGRVGRLGIKARGLFDKPQTVEQLDATCELQLKMERADGFSGLTLNVHSEARGPALAGPAQLGLRAAISTVPTGETYEVTLESNNRNVLSFHGGWVRGVSGVSGDWLLDAADPDFTPFTLGHPLPVFDLKGAGRLSLETGSGTLALVGKLDASLDSLARLDPSYAVLGRLLVHCDFDVAQTADLLRFAKLQFSLSAPSPVLQVSVERAFTVDCARWQFIPLEGNGRLLSLSIQGLPLSWLRLVTPDLDFSGSPLTGVLSLDTKDNGFSLNCPSPLEVLGLGLSREGRPLLKAVDLRLAPRGDMLPAGWQAELPELTLSQGNVSLLRVEMRAGRLAGSSSPVLAQGQWAADLPLLLAQPGFVGVRLLESGKASGEFQLSMAEKTDVHVLFSLKDLVSADASLGALPSFSSELRGDLDAAKLLHLEMPLVLENTAKGRNSDLLLAGTVNLAPSIPVVDLKVGGKNVVLQDLGLLAAPFSSAVRPQENPSARKGPAPLATEALWAGVQGQVQLSLQCFELDARNRFENLTGKLIIGPDALSLEKLKAGQSNGGSVSFDGAIGYKSGAEPYSLQAELKIDGFDVSSLFARQGGVVEPVLEAKFDVRSSLSSSGTDLDDLFSRVTGQFSLISRGGICRLLRTDISAALQQKSAGSSLLASGLGALLGSKSSDKSGDNGKLDAYARMATELSTYFGNIPFDQLTVSATRDASYNLRLQELSLISPMLRLSGTGGITYRQGVSLLDQPLALTLQVSARDRMSEYLGKAGLLGTTQDNLGYTALAEDLQIGGSLASPDTSDLKKRLIKTALSKASDDFLQKLLGH